MHLLSSKIRQDYINYVFITHLRLIILGITSKNSANEDDTSNYPTQSYYHNLPNVKSVDNYYVSVLSILGGYQEHE